MDCCFIADVNCFLTLTLTILLSLAPSGSVSPVHQVPAWYMVKDIESDSGETRVRSLARITDLICLAGTGDVNAEIWRSADGGATWSLVKDLSLQSYVMSLARVTDLICLASSGRSGAVDGQIHRSDDAGATSKADGCET